MPETFVAFLIPVHNRWELAEQTLRSLALTAGDRARDVTIVIDDASEDEGTATRAALGSWFRIHRNPENLGFGASINQAVAAVRAPLLVILNSDLVLAPGWLEPMLAVMESEPAAFAVGNVQTSVADGSIDHAGIVFHEEGYPIHFRAAPEFITRRDYREFPAVTAACMLVRRERFLALGGFDESYRNGFEDVDLCLRARMRGWPSFVANHSRVGHHISASPGRKDHEAANARLFLGRWRPLTRVWQRDWDNRLLIEKRRLAGEFPESRPIPPSASPTNPLRVLIDLTRLIPPDMERQLDLVRSLLRGIPMPLTDSLSLLWVVPAPAVQHALTVAAPRDEVWMLPAAGFPAGDADRRLRLAPCSDARLPRLLDADVMLCPYGVSGLLTPDIPVISVFSELLHRELPACLTPAEVAAREEWSDRTVRTTFRILCTSDWLCGCLRHHYGACIGRPEVLPVVASETPPLLPTPIEAGSPCFIYPADVRPYKNHDTLLVGYRLYREARGQAAWPLVLVGRRDNPMERLFAHARALAIADHVEVHEPDTDSALVALRSRAGALVYPSLHEGSELPLIGAMAAGLPVLAGAIASFPAVAGDAALLVDVRDPRAIAEGLTRISTDERLRTDLIARGRIRAAAHSSNTPANTLVNALRAATETFRAAGITWRWDGGRP